MEEDTGPYSIEAGHVVFTRKVKSATFPRRASETAVSTLRVCAVGERVAVAFDADDGALHKHGAEADVQAWAAAARVSLAKSSPDLADFITVIAFPATPETVDELNECIGATGRVMRLEARLRTIGEGGPDVGMQPL